jgi:hypothetical protein
MPTRRNFIDIDSDIRIRLEQNTPITNFSPIGTATNISHLISTETERCYDEIEYIYSIYDPTRNFGKELDNIGFMFGTGRKGSLTAIDNTYTNFYFYIDPRTNVSIGSLIQRLYPITTHYNIRKKLFDEGYIDSVEAPTRLLIPASTTVANNDTSILYTTVGDAFIENASNETYVPVIANVEGSTQNIQANVLIKHNLNENSLLKDLSKYILCSNRYPITTGYDGQPDEEYRYNLTLGRINYGSNEIAVRQAVLGVPGVRDIRFERGRFGNGTFNVIVEGISPIISEGLLNMIKEKLHTLSPGSETVFVNRPDYLGVELKLDIITSLTSNLNTLKESVRNDIIEYINDLPIGGTIVWNKLIDVIMDREGVKDFILNYYKLGEYDVFNKINKKQIVLRTVNQRSDYNQKFYSDAGLVSLCCVQS